MVDPREIWNARFRDSAKASAMGEEPWLDRWDAFFRGRPLRVLDAGCGLGFDTAALLARGHEVTAIDFSPAAIEQSRKRNPAARHLLMDLREVPVAPMPRFDAVVANLSLHYFNEAETKKIFAALFSLLPPEGILAMRVNAEDDVNFGATGDGVSWNGAVLDGIAKQFFTPQKIAAVFEGSARVLSLEKRVTTRFGKSKSIYEVLAQKMPREPGAPPRLTVGAVIFEGFELLDLYGPLQMFGMLRAHRFDLVTLAISTGAVRSSQGPAKVAERDLQNAGAVDVLIVPGGQGTRWEVHHEELLEAVRGLAERATHVLTICTGSALLAKTGMLDGRRATTNKSAFAWVTAQGPGVTWVRQARWVEDGKFYTASGVSAGIDAALALNEKICGAETAGHVARWAEYERHGDPSWDPFAALAGLVAPKP